ncbi:MAG: TIGR03790 family protein, partial [Ignavibacteriae bacterium]|nr:TIGR03790 family protein [Ignavibacteriota bacterium]
RGIPAANMIYISADTTEEIDSVKFNLLRLQVESYLVTNNLQNVINYLVTTKGVPLKINRGSTFSQSSPSSSVESELMLILGSYTSYIGGAGPQMSPYFYQNAHFTRATYGVYLVTRLDAYTVQEVIELIDRSGPNRMADPTSPFLFDQDPSWSSPLNTYLARAKTALDAKGKTTLLDASSVYQTNKQGLAGYISWGSNDHYQQLYTQNAIPHNTYIPGAIAETYVSTSGRSFENPPSYGQSLIADLIREGVSGAKGYVYEPYSNAMAHAYLLFDRYVSGYNLAESFFMSSLLISWMDVVVGDPKTSLTFVPGLLPVQLAGFSAVPYGNRIEFTWRTVSETNNYGFFMQRADTTTSVFADVPNSFVSGNGTTLAPQNYSWSYGQPPVGTFYYRLRQVDLDGSESFSEPIVVTNSVIADVNEVEATTKYRLSQNYPNPFNPTTTIKFTIPARMGHDLVEGHAPSILKVFDVVGREVATLVNGVLQPGDHSVVFDGNGLPSGTYVYQLTSGSFVDSKKFVLLK